MDKNSENEIKAFMAQKLAEGEKLSDLQDAVNAKFNTQLTYMDIRILASTLDVDWHAREPQPPAAPEPEKAEAPAEAESAPADSGTVVEVNKIARPGMAISGTVKFANGATADWYVDQMGRLGLDNLKGDQPGPADIQAFQQELQKIFQR